MCHACKFRTNGIQIQSTHDRGCSLISFCWSNSMWIRYVWSSLIDLFCLITQIMYFCFRSYYDGSCRELFECLGPFFLWNIMIKSDHFGVDRKHKISWIWSVKERDYQRDQIIPISHVFDQEKDIMCNVLSWVPWYSPNSFSFDTSFPNDRNISSRL